MMILTISSISHPVHERDLPLSFSSWHSSFFLPMPRSRTEPTQRNISSALELLHDVLSHTIESREPSHNPHPWREQSNVHHPSTAVVCFAAADWSRPRPNQPRHLFLCPTADAPCADALCVGSGILQAAPREAQEQACFCGEAPIRRCTRAWGRRQAHRQEGGRRRGVRNQVLDQNNLAL